MESKQDCFNGNKRYASFLSQVNSTVAPLHFKFGTVQGTLLLGFYFMAVILFATPVVETLL